MNQWWNKFHVSKGLEIMYTCKVPYRVPRLRLHFDISVFVPLRTHSYWILTPHASAFIYLNFMVSFSATTTTSTTTTTTTGIMFSFIRRTLLTAASPSHSPSPLPPMCFRLQVYVFGLVLLLFSPPTPTPVRNTVWFAHCFRFWHKSETVKWCTRPKNKIEEMGRL